MNTFTFLKQRGASLLEFLVVAPFLVTLAFTAIELGAVFTRYNTLTKTVQDAARYLTVRTNTDHSRAENLIRYNSINADGQQLLPGDTIDIDITENIGAVGSQHVQINITYNHTPVAGAALNNLLQLLGGDPLNLNIALTASSVMRYIE